MITKFLLVAMMVFPAERDLGHQIQHPLFDTEFSCQQVAATWREYNDKVNKAGGWKHERFLVRCVPVQVKEPTDLKSSN